MKQWTFEVLNSDERESVTVYAYNHDSAVELANNELDGDEELGELLDSEYVR